MAEQREERGVVLRRQCLRVERVSRNRLLDGAQQHRHHRAVRVVPVDVVEHLLARVQQRVERADALVADAQTRAVRVLQDAQRAEQPRHVHAAIGDVAGAGVAREVVELVHVQRATEQPHEQRVAGRERAVAWRIDQIGDARWRDAMPVENLRDGAGLDDAAAHDLVRRDGVAQLLDGVREGIVADVVQQRGGEQDAQIERVAADGQGVAAIQQRAQATQREKVDAEAMLEARVRRAGPDAVAEAKLLDALQPHELRRADQVKLELAERDEVVEAVADRADGARVGQGEAVARRAIPQRTGRLILLWHAVRHFHSISLAIRRCIYRRIYVIPRVPCAPAMSRPVY